MRLRLLVLAFGLPLLAPSSAGADWFVTPFIGFKFAGVTTFVDLENGVGDTKLTLGGSGGC